jgi:hypothetical protein
VPLGSILFAMNFDPPEDHPQGFDFTWVSALVNDFRGINDDLDTLEGLGGDHFNTLLEWQPRVDPSTTASLAWVRPGPPDAVAFRDPDAAPRLAQILTKHGYNGIILSGDRDDDLEMETLTAFANGMQRGTSTPLTIARRRRPGILTPPFSMQFRICMHPWVV